MFIYYVELDYRGFPSIQSDFYLDVDDENDFIIELLRSEIYPNGFHLTLESCALQCELIGHDFIMNEEF